MKFIFRGYIVFEYIPNSIEKVIQHQVHGKIPAFDFCRMIPYDYKLLSEFFDKVYNHIQGEDVDLSDIEVY
mgnify:CR=1 FL=1